MPWGIGIGGFQEFGIGLKLSRIGRALGGGGIRHELPSRVVEPIIADVDAIVAAIE